MTIAQAIEVALQHHQAGRLAEAEGIYRQILATAPDHPDALHLLGVIAQQVGQGAVAAGMIERAIALAPGMPTYHSNLGEAYRALGRFDDAIASYRRALQLKPDYADAHSNMGVALAALGRLDEAIASLRKVVQLNPNSAEAHSNLGGVLGEKGCLDEAIRCFRRAIELRPGYPEAHYNLGNVQKDAGRLDEAVAAYRRAIEINPGYAEAHNNLGSVLGEKHQRDEAIASFRRAIELRPGYAEAHHNLGSTFGKMGRFAEALPALQAALRIKPDFPKAGYNLGNIFTELGRIPEAIAAYREALRHDPVSAEAWSNLGGALFRTGQMDAAMSACQEAIRIKPDYAEAHNNRGAVLIAAGRPDEAVAAFRRAIEIRADFAEAWSNLGGPLREQGRIDEAIAADRRAIEIQPDYPKAHSNLLLDLHYVPGLDAGEIFAEHRRWDGMHARPLRKFIEPHRNHASASRRLRIGYVSPDFREHPVALFFGALLAAHDRAEVEVFCYAELRRADRFTERLRRHANAWRDISGMPDAEVAAMIRKDGIDILVDLGGHTAESRLLVFARKPAPVQVTWLGYCDTTGMEAMDHRFTDAHADPPGTTEHLHVEKLILLPETFACFHPAEDSPAVGPLPAASRGHVTFGSFHMLAKINDPLLEQWAAILNQIPGSRLLMVASGLDGGSCEQRLAEFFGKRGIESSRIEFKPRQSLAGYLALHNEVDVMLDSHPFTGHTVSCHALWMGVPVVTLAGKTHCSRMVTSVLMNMQMPEWIARTPEEYVGIARAIAADVPRLATLRASLRERMASSPLTDSARFARNVEHAFREMWRAWCAGSVRPPGTS